jgi:hypothetical protein
MKSKHLSIVLSTCCLLFSVKTFAQQVNRTTLCAKQSVQFIRVSYIDNLVTVLGVAKDEYLYGGVVGDKNTSDFSFLFFPKSGKLVFYSRSSTNQLRKMSDTTVHFEFIMTKLRSVIDRVIDGKERLVKDMKDVAAAYHFVYYNNKLQWEYMFCQKLLVIAKEADLKYFSDFFLSFQDIAH